MARKVEKCREWEKERRDKLNHNFMELSKLLPDHDPSMTLSKKQILTQAAEYIKMLQEQNRQILKEGTNRILKIEAERLRARVAQLLLKTKLLVEALRTAGVPIPRKLAKNVQSKKQPPASNQNELDGEKESTEGQNKNKSPKKKVKCGCDKVKAKEMKNPLKEINCTVDAGLTVASPSSKVDSGNMTVLNKQTAVSAPSAVPISYVENKVMGVPTTTSSVLIPITQTGLINGSVVATGGVQTLAPVLDRNLLSSLGPGTLILADGRVVSVPSIYPSVLTNQTALILMHNSKRKEKLIVPKRSEITKTTYSNKTPIPAIKDYRFESPRPRPPVTRSRLKSSPSKPKVVHPAIPKGISHGGKQSLKRNLASQATLKDITKGNAKLHGSRPENDVSTIEKTNLTPSEINKNVTRENTKMGDQSDRGDKKRKNESSSMGPPSKISKLNTDGSAQEQSLAEKAIDKSGPKIDENNGKSVEISETTPNESLQSAASAEGNCDKDVLKLNQNRHTIDALFNKPNEDQTLKKLDNMQTIKISDEAEALSRNDSETQHLLKTADQTQLLKKSAENQSQSEQVENQVLINKAGETQTQSNKLDATQTLFKHLDESQTVVNMNLVTQPLIKKPETHHHLLEHANESQVMLKKTDKKQNTLNKSNRSDIQLEKDNEIETEVKVLSVIQASKFRHDAQSELKKPDKTESLFQKDTNPALKKTDETQNLLKNIDITQSLLKQPETKESSSYIMVPAKTLIKRPDAAPNLLNKHEGSHTILQRSEETQTLLEKLDETQTLKKSESVQESKTLNNELNETQIAFKDMVSTQSLLEKRNESLYKKPDNIQVSVKNLDMNQALFKKDDRPQGLITNSYGNQTSVKKLNETITELNTGITQTSGKQPEETQTSLQKSDDPRNLLKNMYVTKTLFNIPETPQTSCKTPQNSQNLFKKSQEMHTSFKKSNEIQTLLEQSQTSLGDSQTSSIKPVEDHNFLNDMTIPQSFAKNSDPSQLSLKKANEVQASLKTAIVAQTVLKNPGETQSFNKSEDTQTLTRTVATTQTLFKKPGEAQVPSRNTNGTQTLFQKLDDSQILFKKSEESQSVSKKTNEAHCLLKNLEETQILLKKLDETQALFKKPNEIQNIKKLNDNQTILKKTVDTRNIPTVSRETHDTGGQVLRCISQQNICNTSINITSSRNNSVMTQSNVINTNSVPTESRPIVPVSGNEGVPSNSIGNQPNNISTNLELKSGGKVNENNPSSSQSQVITNNVNSCTSTMADIFSKTTLTSVGGISYSSNSENTGFKGDCFLSSVDFLRCREVQDQRNTFMPIIDDVRLTSEFSSDLFNSLQVPSAIGGQHPESISPTAAFLLAFPLVSTSKNVDNPVDGENNENQQTNTPTTILQIGNIEPPSTSELFHSIDYPSKGTKHFGNKESIDRFHSYELGAEYEANMGIAPEVQKPYRNNSEKKKDVSLYTTHEEYRNKSQRRQQCDQSQMSQERPKENTAGVCAVGGTSNYQQQQPQLQPQQQQQCYSGYPLFTHCNDFSSVMPPPTNHTSQYSSIGVGTDPKADVINMLPWASNNHLNQHQDFTPNQPAPDKDICLMQKNKNGSDRKSKSDKVTQKGSNYNTNQYNNMECYNFKQEKKKNSKQNQQVTARAPVNWMTTPDSRNILPDPLLHLDIYTPQKEMDNAASFSVPPPPTGSIAQNPFANTFPSIEMSIDSFTEFNTSKKTTNNYCWSPSKCLLPPSVDNHGLVIPSTLPTLMGDLALGTTTTTTADTLKTFETSRKFDQNIRKLPEKGEKKRNDYGTKNQGSNSSFLSVSQLVDPKCKKQTKHQQQQVDLNKNCSVKRNSSADKGTLKSGQRTNFNYASTNTLDRKDHRVPDPNCIYSNHNRNVPPSQWNEKQRNNAFKGGSYSAESLIGLQQQPMGQNQGNVGNNGALNSGPSGSYHQPTNIAGSTNYQGVQSSAVNYFQSTGADYGAQNSDTPQGSYTSTQYHQNCFNFPTGQPHFSSGFISEDYQMDNFVGFNVSGSSTTNCQPHQTSNATSDHSHHQHHHQQLQQQTTVDHKHKRQQVNSNSSGKCAPREDHTNRAPNEELYHNSRISGSNSGGFIQPSQVYHPGGYSFPPPPSSSKVDMGYMGPNITPVCSQHLSLTTNTTTTLTNFNLSTIFPEMNDQRGPPSSTSHLNSSTFTNLPTHNYHQHHHHPPLPPLPH